MLSPYYQEVEGKISFTREQGSSFAKGIADDFNPLHNVDAKRFCVPGDLLFSLVLQKYGVSEKMQFSFIGMVTENVNLEFPAPSDKIDITCDGKSYLTVERSGANSSDAELIENLTKSYVRFSGSTFPHILVPLMSEQGVMINPARPMVMYQSMAINLERLDAKAPNLNFAEPSFELAGKRGNITLPFDLVENGETIGHGEKHMIVSGILPYDAPSMDELITAYNNRSL